MIDPLFGTAIGICLAVLLLSAAWQKFTSHADFVAVLGNYRLPKKHKTVGGEIDGERAVLEVEGELFPGQKALYFVQMVKGEAGWQYETSMPAGMID